MNTKVDSSRRNMLFSVFSGVIVAVAVTLVLILIFALLIRFFNISDKAIFPVNQVIKVISIFVGSITVIKTVKSRGFLMGVLLGVLYYILSYLVFSLLQGGFSLNLSNVYDFLLTTIMSGVIGIISVNIIK
jgi:putative membrane protein (TIGR04086 family)